MCKNKLFQQFSKYYIMDTFKCLGAMITIPWTHDILFYIYNSSVYDVYKCLMKVSVIHPVTVLNRRICIIE